MKDIRDFKDIHSHRMNCCNDETLVCLSFDDDVKSEGFYSIGLHPWKTDMDKQSLEQAMNEVTLKASHRNVVAVGECGIDRLRGADIKVQTEIFRRHIALSEQLHKPLIIHAVKSYDIILRLKKELKPSQLWIIHGFRGKPETARQLTDNGIALSFGEKFNSESVLVTPADLLFTETDESDKDIAEIRKNILSTTC